MTATSKMPLRKETMYKTCKFEGEFVGIEEWYLDGDSFMYLVERIDGTRELVHHSECSEFCL